MEAIILLANASNMTANGQLNILGLGWDVIGPAPLPSHVVVVVMRQLPGDPPRQLRFALRLVNERDEAVVLGTGESRQPVEVHSEIAVGRTEGRPAGLPGGAMVSVEMAAGLPLDPGVHEWVLTVQDERQEWRRRFYVRAKPDEFPAKPGMITGVGTPNVAVPDEGEEGPHTP